MTFQVRLYIHHDNDLIQLHLNGIRLSDLFEQALEAHYKHERIRFDLPAGMELKPNKKKVYRIKITLDDQKQRELIRWVQAFPDKYKCHCIKNIARSFLGTAAIDVLNEMTATGEWTPDPGKNRETVRSVRMKKPDAEANDEEASSRWLDKISAERVKSDEQLQDIEAARERIRRAPTREILGYDLPENHESRVPDDFREDREQTEEDEFDASMYFEQLRTQ